MKALYIFLISFSICSSENWKEVFSKEGIVIYAKAGDLRIIPFKAVSEINYPLEKVLSVLKDWENKNTWSPKLKSVKMHKIINENEYVFSEYYKTPWPATDREFLLKGFIKNISQNKIKLLASSIIDNKLKDSDHIQAEVKNLDLTLERVSPLKTKITFEFYGDMKGWMPAWLINIIQKKWPYRFIQSLKVKLSEIK